jgi:hypothetical protein
MSAPDISPIWKAETLTERDRDRSLLEIHSEPASDTDQIGALGSPLAKRQTLVRVRIPDAARNNGLSSRAAACPPFVGRGGGLLN